jgi:hypothetical protein
MLGTKAYLHALQPFFDRAGRGAVDETSDIGAVAADSRWS